MKNFEQLYQETLNKAERSLSGSSAFERLT